MSQVRLPRVSQPGRWLAAAALCGLLGCDLPRDPEQTLQQVQSGKLRVGVSHCPPWTDTSGEQPGGIEPELVEQLAEQLDAKVEWTVDGQDRVLESLGRYELDLVVCGLTDSSPWFDLVGATQAYATVGDVKHIMAAPLGENRWLLQLDRFLQERKDTIAQRVQAEAAP